MIDTGLVGAERATALEDERNAVIAGEQRRQRFAPGRGLRLRRPAGGGRNIGAAFGRAGLRGNAGYVPLVFLDLCRQCRFSVTILQWRFRRAVIVVLPVGLTAVIPGIVIRAHQRFSAR